MASQTAAFFSAERLRRTMAAASYFKFARFTACLAASMIGLSLAAVAAEPCDDLAIPLREADRSTLATDIASQIHVDSVSIDQAYRSGDWSIFYVVTNEMDQTFLIYSGEPGKKRYQALWGGAPTDYSDQQVLDWTHTNAKGMPEPLARCLSWAVRQDRPPQQ